MECRTRIFPTAPRWFWGLPPLAKDGLLRTADDIVSLPRELRYRLTATPRRLAVCQLGWSLLRQQSHVHCRDNQRYFGASGIQQVIGSRDDDLLGSLIRNMLQGPQLLNGKI